MDVLRKKGEKNTAIPKGDLEKLKKKLKAIELKEGGPGSGHWGHKGRKGKKGGSAPGGGGIPRKFPKDFKDVTRAQKIAQASYADIKRQMARNIKHVQTASAKLQATTGPLTVKTMGVIADNMRTELSTYTAYLAGDTVDLMHQYIASTERVVTNHIREFEGIDSKNMQALCLDSIRKLVHQEVESNRQQFTDHGIRHIVKNIAMQNKILDAMEKQGFKVTGRERLLGNFIMVNHDVGYTVPLIRQGGLRGILASSDHPLYSMRIAGQQRELWNVGKIFTRAEYARALRIIRTHDATTMDMKDCLATATRIADNLALFQAEKLPSMFQYVPGGKLSIMKMALAAKKNNTAAFDRYKKELYAKIDKSGVLSGNLKRDLKAAVKEISYLTPKFTIGVLAGEIDNVEPGKKSLVSVTMKFNKYDQFLQKHFDMGQKQARKFLEDYGQKDFSKNKYYLGKYKDKAILELRVLGAPVKV